MDAEQAWPFGGGMMGALIRAHHWSDTPIGPIEAWPQALRTAVGIMLSTRHPVFIFWGPEHVCLYNDAYSASLGPEKHPSILGVPGRHAFPEIWSIVLPQIEQIMAGGEPTWHEDRLVPIIRNGRHDEVYWTYSLGPITEADAASGVGGVLAICSETTQAVIARRESRERFRALVEASSQVVYRMSPDWSELRQLTSSGFLLGTDVPSRDWLNRYIHPDDQAQCTAAFQEAIRTKGTFDLEHRVRRTDGTLGWTHSRAVPILGADSEVVEWFGAASDVTDRKEAEAALRASEERFRLMADAVPAFVWISDALGRVEFFNRRWWDYTGMMHDPATAAEVAATFIHPDEQAVTMDRFDAARASGNTFLVEHRIRSKQGTYRWFLVRGEPYRDPGSGEIIRWFGTSIDIHDLKQAEQTAERANLSKSQFLAAASHDLRQPMQSLFLFASALGEHVDNAPGRRALSLLNQSLDTMKLLLDSLLDISRLDSGKVQPAVVTFPLDDSLKPLADMYQPIATNKGLFLVVESAQGIEAHSDPALLDRILRNLVENALRYTEAGQVKISCRTEAAWVWIDVADTGPGIAPEHQKWIFEEFHQLGNSERDRNQGLGLGLTIVERLSKLLDHKVELCSEPGQGAVFSVRVPVVSG